MRLKDVSEDLKKGRRALDEISEVNILEDWQFDESLKKWYLKISIALGICGPIPANSTWYVVVEDDYPKGTVKIYPDVNGCDLTFEHQSNNGEIEKNGLWRKGSLCLDSQLKSLGKYNYESEPLDSDFRIFWNVQRAIYWITDADADKLVKSGDPFELPQFNYKFPYFIFSEDQDSFRHWSKVKNNFGIVELDLCKSKILFYYFAKEFKTHKGKTIFNVNWGEYLSQRFKNPITAIWVMLDEVPVIKRWQAPNFFNELINACDNQGIELLKILKRIIGSNSHTLRDGNSHLLLLGFPIPEKIGSENSTTHWQAIELPVLFKGDKKGLVKGFRNPESFLWKRDIVNKLNKNEKLKWLESQNWSLEKITNRGRLPEKIRSMKILIIGVGTIGASVAELLVRSGVTNILLIDSDRVEIGNLSRHSLGYNQIGNYKSKATALHLNQINPHVKSKYITKDFEYSKEFFEEINKSDIIIDCTGENSVLDTLEKFKFGNNKIFISISIGFAAIMLYLSLQQGNSFKSDEFYEKISPWIEKEIENFPDGDLPRDGTKCWSPIFPARYDDILLASSTAVKVIEDFICQDKQEMNVVFKQESVDGDFVGYKKVE